jgi:hypothetical protein
MTRRSPVREGLAPCPRSRRGRGCRMLGSCPSTRGIRRAGTSRPAGVHSRQGDRRISYDSSGGIPGVWYGGGRNSWGVTGSADCLVVFVRRAAWSVSATPQLVGIVGLVLQILEATRMQLVLCHQGAGYTLQESNKSAGETDLIRIHDVPIFLLALQGVAAEQQSCGLSIFHFLSPSTYSRIASARPWSGLSSRQVR